MVTDTIIKKGLPDETSVKAGYKQTELGVIPEDWSVKKLGDIADITKLAGFEYTNYFNSYKDGGEIIVIRGTNITYNKLDLTDIRTIPRSTSNKLPRSKLSKYDLVFAYVGTIGPVFLIDKDDAYHLGPNTSKITVQECMSPNFLFTYFKSWLVQNEIVEHTSIGAQPSLSMTKIRRFRIILPPTKTEQTAIATVLSDTDALIECLEKLIAKKKAIKQGAMQQLLTGKKRLPGFRGEWEVKKLGEIGEITGAGIDKKLKSDEIPVRLVNYLDVYHKDFIYSKDLNHWVTAPFSQSQRCAVKKGDIFFTPSSEMRYDIGISAVAMEGIPDAGYSYHVDRLRLFDDWDLAFRAYIFKTKNFLDQAETICEGSGKRYVISLTKFREITVGYPVDKSEQTAIAAVLFDMDAEIEKLEQKRDKYTMLKQGMMQQLLTGRIRIYANN